jgi:predicted DNA-binding protein (MmcQ/YjbR family)
LKRPKRGKVTRARLLPRLRRLCLRFPGAIETTSWGHPTFKAGGKTFCVLEPYQGHLTLCFRLGAAEQAARLRDPRYLKTPYVGEKGGVSLIVDEGVDWAEVEELLLQGFCEAAPDRLRAQLVVTARPSAKAPSRRS